MTPVVLPVAPGTAFGEIDARMGLGDDDKSMVVGVTAQTIKDGMSKTVFAMSVPGLEIPWTQPEDIRGDPVDLLAEARKMGHQSIVIATGDAAVRRLSTDVKPESVRAMFSRSGDDSFSFDD